MKITNYSIKGTKLTDLSLPKELGGVAENSALLAQAIRVYEERSHTGLADTKTRAEVNRTKKKWYKQKGTGGARHGAKSAPIFVGGGVAHGPKPVRRVLTLPKKMVQKALSQALSLKAAGRKIVAVTGMEKFTKTSQVAALLKKLGPAAKYTFVLNEKNFGVKRYFRNIPEVKILLYRNLNAFDVFLGGTIVFDAGIFVKK